MPRRFRVPAHRRSVVAVSLVSVLACVLSACTAGRAGSAARDNTLVVDTSFVYKTLDPGRVYEQTGYLAVHALYESLLTFEGGDVTEPKPGLAESYEVSSDATRFTFTLRDEATFSDGSSVTADDVEFSLERLVNLKGSTAAYFEGLDVAAPDRNTVVVTADEPNPNVPVLLAMPAASILNADVVTDHGGTSGRDAASEDRAQSYLDRTTAGSGPYVLERNEPGEQLVLTANDNYWGDAPAYPRVVVRNMEAQNQKLTLTRSSSPEIALDIAGTLLDGLPPSLSVSQKPDTAYFSFVNTDPEVSPVGSRPAFVRAVRAALDYRGLADLLGSRSGPARGLIAPAYPGALPEEDTLEQDLPRAKQLLADAGLTDPAIEFIYPAITYRGVDLGTIATKVQGDAAKAGITINLRPLPLNAFLEQYRGGDAQMGMTPQALTYPRADSMVRVMSPGGVNAERMNWTDDTASAAVRSTTADFLAATTDEERVTAVEAWQHAMHRDSPYVLLGNNSGTVVSTPEVAGADYTPAGWIVDLAAVRRAG
ncbi:peptide/nickel transport system substrate-binding protein [Prauserella sediminis]|uniref:Peptide/nickel transport system substrate-binding protein n=1 Tax=Prauserella sediminis TaxID=577680 RepID=A0A839XN38_9PSEU|nr:ABC transporter substrate-binding protein [Prauserella sediminis]MBB3664670.1 peptide/nickel transport system substrate-binding protein [Prauserella sediminis]